MATAATMQRITRTPEGCQYNIEVLSITVECIEPPNPQTDWSALPKHAKWAKTVDFPTPPPVGTRVRVKVSELGTGTVQGYFIEHGWVGVHILPDARPAWHIAQNGPDKNYYLVFGNEIARES